MPALHEIDVVIGERFLITYHDGPRAAIGAAHEVLPRRPELLRRGPVHLLHYMLDLLVDDYFPILDRSGRRSTRSRRECSRSTTTKGIVA